MHTSTLLLAIAASAALAHVAPRQASGPAPPLPAPTAPAAPIPPTAEPAPTADHDTIDHPNKPTAAPTPTRPVPSAYKDLAQCELAIDTLLKAFSMVPTPNAALSSFLATETRAVADPCQWASDVPDGLEGAYSTYSREYVSVLSQHGDLVTQLVSCVDAGGASVTRAEMVTPLFKLPECAEVQVSTTAGGGNGNTAAATTTTRGFPTGTSSAGVGATGVAMVGVAAAALLGVVGGL
ncbi:hypothetical protein V8F20_003414 [Naviculisporaceae sp. PSN 640]